MTVFEKLPDRIRGYLTDYLLVLGDARKKLRGITVMMLVLACLDLLGVGLVAPFAQMLTAGPPVIAMPELTRDPRLAFLLLGLALIAVFLVKAILGYRLNHAIVAFSAGYRADLIRRLMVAYQTQSWQFHLDRNSNDLVNRVLWYTDSYAGSTLSASLQFVTNGLVCIALFVLLSVSDIVSVSILVVFLGTVFLVTHHVVRPRLKEAAVQSAKHNGQVIRGTKQALEGFREVRILGMEAHFRDEVTRAAHGAARANARSSALGMVPRYTFEVAVVTVLVVIGTTTALMKGSPSSAVPVLGMFAAAAIRLIPASTSLLHSLNQIRAGRFVLRDLAAELSAVRGHEAESGALASARSSLPPFELLELQGVSFAYPGATTPVLREVDLSIRAGQTVGLMGRSGVGKSTLADVILGFFVPQSGEVRVNGENIQADVKSWLCRATYIPQRVFLLDDTLRGNIEFGASRDEQSAERMRRAIEQAQLAELIDALPDGLETFVGEGGMRLSGGQRQRVALARALYHEREFIVLDEATSALDQETEDAVVNAVMGLAGSKTLFIIAHRESTLAGCDTRLVMQDGRLRPLAKPEWDTRPGDPNPPARVR